MSRITPTQKLAALILGQPVHEWIADRRDEGVTWRRLPGLLCEVTQGQIDVTDQTLRHWINANKAA